MVRSTLRIVIASFAVGALVVSGAWAGAVWSPLAPEPPIDDTGLPLDLTGGSVAASPVTESVSASAVATAGRPGDVYLAGASKLSIYPRPPEGERWQTEGCATGFANGQAAGYRKTSTPDCIYMGGRGLGPSEPITRIDPGNGLYVRTVAVRDREGDTVVLTQIDGVYWFGRYGTFCERCGSLTIAEDLSEELGLDPSNFFIAGNHSHNSPDFIGGWGGAPTWYVEQVGETVRASIRQAILRLQPAVIEYGETLSRNLNEQRREFYWSAEDAGFSWFRALAAPGGDQPAGSPIATVGSFSAHPVTTGYDGGRAHADWPGAFSNLVGGRDGGVGIAFVSGLGNMSTRQGTWETAEGLYGLLPRPGHGDRVRAVDVATAQAFWDQPITNLGLIGLRAGLFFDRPIDGAPNELRTGKQADTKPCTSGSAVTIRTAASAARIGGDVAISGGPGELFSNLTNTVKEQTSAAAALPLANVNDGLGYIMQSFETDHAGRQVLGFTDAPVEYEDAFSLDHCFGDMTLQTILGLLNDLGARAD